MKTHINRGGGMYFFVQFEGMFTKFTDSNPLFFFGGGGGAGIQSFTIHVIHKIILKSF